MQSVSSIGKQSHFAGPLTLKAGIKYKASFMIRWEKTVSHCSFTSVAPCPLVIFRHMTVSNLFYSQSLASQPRNYRGRGTPVLRGSDHRHTLACSTLTISEKHSDFASPPKLTSHAVAKKWQR